MIIGKVIGNVWATRKEESLSGMKLLIVEPMNNLGYGISGNLVAVDRIGAGKGEQVLVTLGSSARNAVQGSGAVIDAAIIGIIDQLELEHRNT